MRPNVFETAPICFEIAFLFLPESASHPDPRLFDDELANFTGFYGFAVLGEYIDVHSEARSGKRTGLLRQQRIAHQNAARDLGPTGVVDDRQLAVTDLFE